MKELINGKKSPPFLFTYIRLETFLACKIDPLSASVALI